jgi:hypothetical protein
LLYRKAELVFFLEYAVKLCIFVLKKRKNRSLTVRGREWIAVQWMVCIAYGGGPFIGGKDPLGPAAQGGGGWGR